MLQLHRTESARSIPEFHQLGAGSAGPLFVLLSVPRLVRPRPVPPWLRTDIRGARVERPETAFKRTFVLPGKSLPISHLNEFERLQALALGAMNPQGRVLWNQGAAEIRATASSVVQTALAIKRKLIKAAK